MGTSFRHILVDQNDAVIRLSNRLFERLWDDSQSDTVPQFAGCRVRWAEAVVELKDRKLVGILRVVFCYLYFDHQGRLDRDKVMKDGALMIEAGIGSLAPTKSGSVIHASSRFAARRRDHELSGSQAWISIRQFTTQRSIPNRTNVYDHVSSARLTHHWSQ